MHHEAIQPLVNSVEWIDLHPPRADFRAEVLKGLRSDPKRLPAKFFYDERGSELFEEITRLPEYYLTRSELEILHERAGEIVAHFGDAYTLVEFGSGSCTKVKILLDAGSGAAAYMPIDISADFLRQSVEELAATYASLRIVAVCADYTHLESLPSSGCSGKRIIFFPGSTVGNLDPAETRRFFSDSAKVLQRGDGLLIGADLRKDTSVLHAAYNDAAGVTAEFNRNVLRRINRELGAAFDADSFEHVAFFNEQESRIEMHLRTDLAQHVEVGGETIAFHAGEMIHTENSYKYDLDGFYDLFEGSRFVPRRRWTDRGGMFSVHYLEVE